MGAATIRITKNDFLTPPEFAGLSLAPTEIGQIGGLRLELVSSNGLTRLCQCYQQMPLRILPPFHFASERAALVYILNPTVGLLDGDAHRIDLVVRPGCRAVVTGQSANRIHPAIAGFSTQQWHVRVEAGAELVVLPGPTIPYRGCRYYQHAVVDLAADARLIWGDIWLPGRHGNRDDAEIHAFDRMVQCLEIRREGRLVYRDRFDWRGPWSADVARWHLGDAVASGTLFVSGPLDVSSATVLELASGDNLVRVCGDPTAVTTELVRVALAQAGAWSDGPAWLVVSGNFGPNHWFS